MSPDDILIEWTKTDSEPEPEAAVGGADVAVFTDGRVKLSARLADGEPLWGQLSADELKELRRLVFDEARILDIDGEALARGVKAAAARRKASTDAVAFELVTAPQMDANTTVLHVADEGRAHEVRYYDLFGDAETYPEVEDLQRLRRIELRLLEIAEALARPPA